MKCSYCGANIPDGELYCPECGTEVQIVPDYNPLEDVLAQQVKASIDGSSRQEDVRRRDGGRRDTERTPHSGRSRQQEERRRREMEERRRREAEERRKQQMARKRALAKKRRARVLIVLALICVAVAAGGFFLYQTSYASIVRKGNASLAAKEYATANAYFNKAVKKDASKAAAYTGLSDVLVEQDDVDSAENIFFDAISVQPSNAELYKACINFYIKTKQSQKIPILIDNCDEDTVIDVLENYIVSTPEFSLEDGTYDDVQEVSLSSDGEAVYYTTDGTDPTDADTKYTQPILLDEGETVIKAVSFNQDKIPSMIVSMTYTIDLPVADAPAVVPSTGQHSVGTEISVSVPEGYTAYYTMDGTDPNSASAQYTGPIYMSEGQTIFKAVLINSKGKSTQITTRTYITE